MNNTSPSRSSGAKIGYVVAKSFPSTASNDNGGQSFASSNSLSRAHSSPQQNHNNNVSGDDSWKKGVLQFQMKQLEEAIDPLNRSLKLNPDDADAWYNKGLLLKEKQKTSNSYQNIQYQTEADFYYQKGIEAKQNNQFQNAFSNFESAIRLKLDFAEAYYAQGECLSELKNIQGAILSWEEVIKLKPDSLIGNNSKGLILQANSKFEEAVEWFNQTLSSDPSDIDANINKGISLSYISKIKLLNSQIQSQSQSQSLQASGFSVNVFIEEEANPQTDISPAFVLYSNKTEEESERIEPRSLSQMREGKDSGFSMEEGKGSHASTRFEEKKSGEILSGMNPGMRQSDEQKCHQMFENKPLIQSESSRGIELLSDKSLRTSADSSFKTSEQKNIFNSRFSGNSYSYFHEEGEVNYFNQLTETFTNKGFEDKEISKLKRYFSAFIETFLSVYNTCLLVRQGQTELYSSNEIADFLSALISLDYPLPNKTLIVKEVLTSEEFRFYASQVLTAVPNSKELCQTMEKIVYDMLLNERVQKAILQNPNELINKDLKEKQEKLIACCESIEEEINPQLYLSRYTFTREMGHEDANNLISMAIKEQTSEFRLPTWFISLDYLNKKYSPTPV